MISKNFIKIIIDDAQKLGAIAFAKWINAEGYREYDESDRWISIEQSNQVFTTSQLYDKFEKSLADTRLKK